MSEEVISNIKQHKIDGKIFLQLNEEYLREVAPLLGDRMKLKQVISEALVPQSLPVTPPVVVLRSPLNRSDNCSSSQSSVELSDCNSKVK